MLAKHANGKEKMEEFFTPEEKELVLRCITQYRWLVEDNLNAVNEFEQPLKVAFWRERLQVTDSAMSKVLPL